MQAVAIAFGANYEVLFCCLPGFKANGRCVKVDIMILLIACGLLGPLGEHLADQLHPGHAALCSFGHEDAKMERTQGFAPSDFSDKVEADITDIRALVVRALQERISYRKKYRRHTRGFMEIHGRARRLALGFVEVCSGQMKFQKLSFPLSAVCDQRTSSLPHLDHRNYLRFRAQAQPTTLERPQPPVLRYRPVTIIMS